MAKILNIAAINGMVLERGEEPDGEELRQLNEALVNLDGTGVDLVVTCETMMMSQKTGTGEELDNPGPRLTAFRDFAKRNKCVVAGACRLILDGNPRQSIVYYGHEGEVLGLYHKMFPTPQAIAKGTIPGDGGTVVDTPAGKLGGILCFDLNFDELRDDGIEYGMIAGLALAIAAISGVASFIITCLVKTAQQQPGKEIKAS